MRPALFNRACAFMGALALAWGVAAAPARACSLIAPFSHATPPGDTTLPSGEVFVALHYEGGVSWPTDTFHVTNQLGEDVPATVTAMAGGMLLQFDTTGATEVSLFGYDTFGGDAPLVSYEVSGDEPDLGVPTAPSVTVGQATCTACPEPLNSCCERQSTEGQLNTPVSFATTQPGTILGWVNGGGQLLGVITPGTTYHSAPTYSYDQRPPPAGASIVAMTVAGVMSTPATYALDQEGPCDVMFPPSMVAGDGCSVSQAETTRASALLWALGAAALFVRRKRRG